MHVYMYTYIYIFWVVEKKRVCVYTSHWNGTNFNILLPRVLFVLLEEVKRALIRRNSVSGSGGEFSKKNTTQNGYPKRCVLCWTF